MVVIVGVFSGWERLKNKDMVAIQTEINIIVPRGVFV